MGRDRCRLDQKPEERIIFIFPPWKDKELSTASQHTASQHGGVASLVRSVLTLSSQSRKKSETIYMVTKFQLRQFCSPISAEILRHCVWSGGTQRDVDSRLTTGARKLK